MSTAIVVLKVIGALALIGVLATAFAVMLVWDEPS